jgi:energy-coupling factor transporter ATP-binding protein EcfA2
MDHGTRVRVGGDAVGQLVVGDHLVTVFTEQSVVAVIAPADRPKPVRRPVITLRPRRPATLFGRDRELAALRETGRLVQVFGPPGVGKSTLIRYVAGRLRPGAVFLSAAGRSVDDLLQDVFEATYDVAGYRPTPAELRRLMSGVELRLLIDDLDVSADERAELLDGLPDASVIFTSVRRSLWGNGDAVELRGLDRGAALELLASMLNRQLAEDERGVATELWHATDGSPLQLLRAAGRGRLSRAGELAALLPRTLAALDPEVHEVVAVLDVAGSPVSAALLPWLVAAPGTLSSSVHELTVRGLVIVSERGYQLAPGVGTQPPTVPRLEWLATRLREGAVQLPPLQLAYHARLVTGVIEAATRLGRPDIGARLAKAVAPVVACSGRLGAWGRILTVGRDAAQRAGDRATLAYLSHEAGVRALVTGDLMAAATAVNTAIALWHELGHPARATVAQQVRSFIGGVGGGASMGHAS